MSSWSDLHSSILEEIFHRLEDDPFAFIRVGAVCSSWRSSSLAHRRRFRCCPPKTLIPWLLLTPPDTDDLDHLSFFSLTEQKTFRIRTSLPGLVLPGAGDFFLGSTRDGLLVSADAFNRLYIAEPLTGAHFPLPHTSNLPSTGGPSLGPSFIKAVVGWTPQGFMAAILHTQRRLIAMVKLGDRSWTPFMCPEDFDEVDDIVFHKGRLYAFSAVSEMTFAFDPSRPSEEPISFGGSLLDEPVILGSSVWCGGESMVYLVESLDGDDLLLVAREYKTTDVGRDGNKPT